MCILVYMGVVWTANKQKLKGRGPGINSSQSKNVGKIQLSMQLSHLSIIFENIINGFNDYNKFQFLACEQLTCLCIIYPAFVVIEKLSWD